MERFAEDMVRSIDAGLPVVGYPDDMNVAVVSGYAGDASDRTFLWQGYHWPEVHELPATKTGPWLMLLKEHGRPLSRREALIQALTTPNWRRKFLPSWKPEGPPARYLYGDDALATWSNDIAGAEKFTVEQRKSLFFVSWWCFTSLADARRQAASFCKSHADQFQGEGRKALVGAAAVYQKEAQMLGEVFGAKNAFLGPWSGKKFEDWTPGVRKREQEILARVRQLDAQAKAAIDEALAAEGVKLTASATESTTP
jgi:hypothetical protein